MAECHRNMQLNWFARGRGYAPQLGEGTHINFHPLRNASAIRATDDVTVGPSFDINWGAIVDAYCKNSTVFKNVGEGEKYLFAIESLRSAIHSGGKYENEVSSMRQSISELLSEINPDLIYDREALEYYLEGKLDISLYKKIEKINGHAQEAIHFALGKAKMELVFQDDLLMPIFARKLESYTKWLAYVARSLILLKIIPFDLVGLGGQESNGHMIEKLNSIKEWLLFSPNVSQIVSVGMNNKCLRSHYISYMSKKGWSISTTYKSPYEIRQPVVSIK